MTANFNPLPRILLPELLELLLLVVLLILLNRHLKLSQDVSSIPVNDYHWGLKQKDGSPVMQELYVFLCGDCPPSITQRSHGQDLILIHYIVCNTRRGSNNTIILV